MSNLFKKTREFIDKSFRNEAQMLHFDRTVHWLKVLKPDADEASLIAAIGHDIERAFRKNDPFENKSKKFTDENHLKNHQETGAKILEKFLKEQGADLNTIKKVKHLVSNHEIGGDVDQNLLKDADSLSFLENNADIFLKRLEKLGYSKVKEKFDWMYFRITQPKAKKIGKPFYKKIIKKLDSKSPKSN
jgi:hypothetical protein